MANVGNHPGMKDQTSSNIARDGAAKKPQTSFPAAHGMRDRTAEMQGVSPANPGVGPDADPANPLSPSPKLKKFGDVPVNPGIKNAPGNHSPAIGHAVLREAANLGR